MTNDPLSQIDLRILEIRAQIDKLSKELEELDIAKRVFSRLSGEPLKSNVDILIEAGKDLEAQLLKSSTIKSQNTENALAKYLNFISKSNTVKELIVRVLADNPEIWMIASDIQQKASNLKGSDVPMTTISPTLTTLKDEGLIVRDGLKVALKKRLLPDDLDELLG